MEGLTFISSSEVYGYYLAPMIVSIVLFTIAIGIWIIMIFYINKGKRSGNMTKTKINDIITITATISVTVLVIGIVVLAFATQKIIGFIDTYTIDNINNVDINILMNKYDSIEIMRDTIECTNIYTK